MKGLCFKFFWTLCRDECSEGMTDLRRIDVLGLMFSTFLPGGRVLTGRFWNKGLEQDLLVKLHNVYLGEGTF